MPAPLCKDCHLYEASFSFGADACLHVQAQFQEPVRGRVLHKLCGAMRVSGECGPEGKLFEAAQRAEP